MSFVAQWRPSVVLLYILDCCLNSWRFTYTIMRATQKHNMDQHTVVWTKCKRGWLQHYDDVIIRAMASQITTFRMFTQRFPGAYKKNIKAPRRWPLCGDRWIPRTRASNAESVSIWWRHHEDDITYWWCIPLNNSSQSCPIDWDTEITCLHGKQGS